VDRHDVERGEKPYWTKNESSTSILRESGGGGRVPFSGKARRYQARNGVEFIKRSRGNILICTDTIILTLGRSRRVESFGKALGRGPSASGEPGVCWMGVKEFEKRNQGV